MRNSLKQKDGVIIVATEGTKLFSPIFFENEKG